MVALRKESVDRNACQVLNCQVPVSLSARRAWIEIMPDANSFIMSGSLSARRAWIEIA